ncbi:MAG TPA: hypothetical protein VFM82_07950, partial [Flavobacteriaceae bacterium]|nr:hypothetical protein [Flavobacteriaceae bacterium]
MRIAPFFILLLPFFLNAQTDSIATRVSVLEPAGIILKKPFPPSTSIDSLKIASFFAASKKPSISYWKQVNKIGLDLNEVAFVNWNAGGNNS